MQYSTDIRDAQNNAVFGVCGPSPTLAIFGGDMPANCMAMDTGAQLAIGTLPADWMAQSMNGAVSKSGLWTLLGQSGAGAGTPGIYFRIKAGGVCKLQGTFGAGQDMVPDQKSLNRIAVGQTVTIDQFKITRGNA